MQKRYVIRQFQDDKKHYYFTATGGMTPFSQRINDSALFNDEQTAQEMAVRLSDDFLDLQVIAVKVNISAVRAK